MRSFIRSGFTMLEVMITSMILVGAMAMCLEVLSSSKLHESHAAAQDEIAEESLRIMRSISADLTFSGWYLPTSEDIDQDGVLTPTEDDYINGVSGVIDAIGYSSTSQTTDRGLWYYPYIQVQDATGSQTAGLGSRYTIMQRPTSAVALALPISLQGGNGDASISLTDPAWSTSFKARSQEIIFLKAITGSWNEAQESYDLDATNGNTIRIDNASYAATGRSRAGNSELNFSGVDGKLTREDWQSPGTTTGIHDKLGVMHASGWSAVMSGTTVTGYAERNTDHLPYGVTLDSGWFDITAAGTDDDLPVKVQWDTVETPTMTKADWYKDKLREYTYAVVPTPAQLGLGRLLRAHKVRVAALPSGVTEGYDIGQLLPVRHADATSSTYRMRVDRVLSDNVVRIVFDTYRTVDSAATEVTTLSPNQIRIRLYMARRQVTNPDVVVSRISESLVGMRSRSSAADVSSIMSQLGTAPVGVAH